MTGYHFLFLTAALVLIIGLYLILRGKESDKGSFKFHDIELSGSTPLLMIGIGCVCIVLLANYVKDNCIIVCAQANVEADPKIAAIKQELTDSRIGFEEIRDLTKEDSATRIILASIKTPSDAVERINRLRTDIGGDIGLFYSTNGYYCPALTVIGGSAEAQKELKRVQSKIHDADIFNPGDFHYQIVLKD